MKTDSAFSLPTAVGALSSSVKAGAAVAVVVLVSGAITLMMLLD
jgi:hypothetical protein